MNFSIQNNSTMKIKMRMPPCGWPAFGWEELFKWKASMCILMAVFFALASCQKSELLIPNVPDEIEAVPQNDGSQSSQGSGVSTNKVGGDEEDDDGNPSGDEGEGGDGENSGNDTGDDNGDDGVTDKDGCDCDEDEDGEVTDKNGDDDDGDDDDDDDTGEDSGGD